MATAGKQGSWLPDIIAGVTAASGIGYLATVYGVSRWLTRPTRSLPVAPSWDAACTCEDLVCTTGDGLKLSGWVITPPRPVGSIALFHGMRLSRSQFVDRIEFLTGEGYRCIAFDHRAHGLSEGRVTSFGHHEAQDVLAVHELIRSRWPGEPCAALGVSMGAAALCYAVGCQWNGLVLEGVYHDLSTAFKVRIGSEYPRWFRIFAGGVIWLTEFRLGRRLAEMAPWQYLPKQGQTPILLLTGECDDHATPEEVGKLYHCCQGPREFHVVPGASHLDCFEKGGLRYQNLILDFLARNMRQQQRQAA